MFDFNKKHRSILIEYLSFILESICSFKESHADGDYVLMHRGQPGPNLPICPSVFRDNNLQKEAQMVSELKRIAPHEFTTCSSQLECLIKMQHYGLPTRLLDVTFNPLVALFFACSDKQYQDQYGMVYSFADHIYSYDNPLIERNAMLSSYSGSNAEDLAKHMGDNSYFLNSDGTPNKEVLKNMFGEKYHAIVSPLNNERIRRQQGGFLLFGLNIDTQKNPFQKEEFSIDHFPNKTDDNIINVIGVLPDHKAKILDELDSIGINPSFLFPELEHQAAYVKRKFCGSLPDNEKEKRSKNIQTDLTVENKDGDHELR